MSFRNFLSNGVYQTVFRGNLGLQRTSLGVPREMAEQIHHYFKKKSQKIINIFRNIERDFVRQLETLV
jgi:hypothetical protein